MADDHGHRACGEWPSRRAILERAGSGAGAWLFGLAAATSARAAGLCDALLLNCIDYRLQDATTAYMDRIGLRNDYDHVALAGAALAAVTDKRPAWGRTSGSTSPRRSSCTESSGWSCSITETAAPTVCSWARRP